jgi:hypothetical protein
MSFKDWLSKGWLVAHETSASEISELFGIADRDLKDCRTEGLSADWRLNIAYNAALQLAAAALAACGYRAGRDAHHYRVIQSLALTIGAERNIVVRFDVLRKKRNVAGYDRAGGVSEREAEEMFVLAKELYDLIKAWFERRHPELFIAEPTS